MSADERTYEQLNKAHLQLINLHWLSSSIEFIRPKRKLQRKQRNCLYPTAKNIPNVYATLEIHKKNCPYRPIVDYNGIFAYNVSRSLADVWNH